MHSESGIKTTSRFSLAKASPINPAIFAILCPLTIINFLLLLLTHRALDGTKIGSTWTLFRGSINPHCKKTDLHVALTIKYDFKIKCIPRGIRQETEIIPIDDTGEQLEHCCLPTPDICFCRRSSRCLNSSMCSPRALTHEESSGFCCRAPSATNVPLPGANPLGKARGKGPCCRKQYGCGSRSRGEGSNQPYLGGQS